MAGANALEAVEAQHPYPQARRPELSQEFTSFHNYVALPRSEAFRIEYWALEEAKLQRMPPRSRIQPQNLLVVGGGSGIGREVALMLAQGGAHIVVADLMKPAAKEVAEEASELIAGAEPSPLRARLEFRARASPRRKLDGSAIRRNRRHLNTAAIFPVARRRWAADRSPVEHYVSRECHRQLSAGPRSGWVFRDQKLPGISCTDQFRQCGCPETRQRSLRLSKAALNHLIRELAVGFAPLVRVNGIAPATVVAGSTMFPRDRVMHSLQKVQNRVLRNRIHRRASHQARRTSTPSARSPRSPSSGRTAPTRFWLASDESAKTTGHVIPVDGGLQEAFLR